MHEFRVVPPVLMTMLREMLASKTIAYRATWSQCQWDSEDGTEDQLFELFRDYGCPASIEFSQK
jgi:hypothetical protein